MLWIYLAVGANLLIAIAVVIDKYLLIAKEMRPLAYAFGIALLSVLALVLIPFGVFTPPQHYWPAIIGAGVANFAGLVFFFRAVRHSDPSLAAAKVGTFAVLATFGFSQLLGIQSDIALNIPAIMLLALGMFVLGMLGRSIFMWTVVSGTAIGLSFVLLKYLLDGLGFVNGVFWTRMALAGTAVLVLVIPTWGSVIIRSWRKSPRRTGQGLLLSKTMAGSGFLLLYYAIQIGDVVTVTALEGVRFAMVLVLALIFQKVLPHKSERATPHILLGKVIGISLVMAGFFTLIV